jgi:predicted phosphohydrolase
LLMLPNIKQIAMVKFRIMSDLHLEFYTRVSQLERHIQWTEDDKNCHLLLAGDIGNPLTSKKRRGPCNYKPNGHFVDLLLMLKTRFLSVTMISGNHEYYSCRSHNCSMEKIDQVLKTMADSVGVTFLQCDTKIIMPSDIDKIDEKPVVIYGATLFTPVSEQHSRAMNDIIYIADRDTIVAKHKEHLNWLLSQTFSEDCHNIVLTHHVPFHGSDSGYYANVMDRLKMRGPIRCCVCGHTHTNINKWIAVDNASTIPTENVKTHVERFGLTQVLSCCIGYKGELDVQPPVYLVL